MNIEQVPMKGKARRAEGEEGYILVAVLFLVVMVLITLSIAAPKIAKEIQRDREIELVHRGKQYQRAIQLYYKKFGAYPPNMEALEKTNNIRFLRRRYKDPMTGKDEWHLIHFGENKTPTAMGFFGQPLGGIGGSTLAGTGPGGVGQGFGSPIGGNGQNGQNGQGGNGGGLFGNNNNSGSLFGNSSNGSLFGNNNSGGSNFSNNGSNGNNGANPGGAANGSPTDPNAQNATGQGGTGQNGGQPTDPNNPNGTGNNSSTSIFGSSNGGNNQTFGGGGIIGVESTSPKLAILEWKKKKHFNEWEFVYDPASERITIGGGSVGQGIGGAGNSGFGNGQNGSQGGFTNGQQNGSQSIFSNSNDGQQPTQPTPTPTPQPNTPQ